MTEWAKELASARFERAEELYSDGEFLKDGQRLRSAANRYYYSAFYAAKSLLALVDFDASTHGRVIGEFRRLFVKTRTLPVEVSDHLVWLSNARTEGDYKDNRKFTSEELSDLARRARAVLDAVKAELVRRGVGDTGVGDTILNARFPEPREDR